MLLPLTSKYMQNWISSSQLPCEVCFALNHHILSSRHVTASFSPHLFSPHTPTSSLLLLKLTSFHSSVQFCQKLPISLRSQIVFRGTSDLALSHLYPHVLWSYLLVLPHTPWVASLLFALTCPTHSHFRVLALAFLSQQWSPRWLAWLSPCSCSLLTSHSLTKAYPNWLCTLTCPPSTPHSLALSNFISVFAQYTHSLLLHAPTPTIHTQAARTSLLVFNRLHSQYSETGT